jgi:hypothetical protein
MRSKTAASRSSSPVLRLTKTAIGTPQARWREMHQSGRCSIIARMRFSPLGGNQRVSSIACSAFARRSFVAIEMNHCGVLRKISGALERQECG